MSDTETLPQPDHPLLRKTATHYEFIIKPNAEKAPGLNIETVLRVKRNDAKPKVDTDEHIDSLILHHLVNENKWHLKRGAGKSGVIKTNNAFWGRMPPVRTEDRADIEHGMTDVAMEACYNEIITRVLNLSKQAYDIGIWAQGKQLSTFEKALTGTKSTKEFKDEELRTAPMAVVQVNDPGFRGKIKLDGKISSVDDGQYIRDVKASLRENGATREDVARLVAAGQRWLVECDLNDEQPGYLRPFSMADLAQRDNR